MTTPAGPETRTPDALLSWMEALADPTRLRLLRLLERHELGVAELVDVLQLPQSTVSRHLKVLGDLDWVTGRAQGTTNLYRMEPGERDSPMRKLWLLARDQTDGWATLQQDQLRLTRRLAERQPAAQAFFAGAAGQWDKLRGELYGTSFLSDAYLALLPSDWTVADLGCGTGQTACAVSPHVARVIGVDQSAAMLKAAQRRTAICGNVDLRRGSLEALPIEDEACDAALLILSLTYVSDPDVAVREAGRILRPGGRLVVVDLLRHDRDEFRRQMGQQSLGFETAEFESLLSASALRNASARPLPPESGVKGPALVLATATKAPHEAAATTRGEH